jgi:hypothetical protein
MRDVVKQFKEDVEAKIPKKLKPYREAIEKKELLGSFKPGELAYAVVAEGKKLKLKDVNKRLNVVYVVQKKREIDEYAQLLIENGPWAIARLPVNIPDTVKLIHREVTKEEVRKVQDANDKMLGQFKRDFEAAGARFGKIEEEPEQPESMSDLLFKALRMEFGIKHQAMPHWGHAYKRIEQRLRGLMRKEGSKYESLLGDETNTDWVTPLREWDKISVQEFMRKYKDFQKKVI